MPASDPPSTIDHDGRTFVLDGPLTDAFHSSNLLYRAADGDAVVLKLGRFRIPFGFLLNGFAGLMARHEWALYHAAAGIRGIPGAGPRVGRTGFVHDFVPGRTLARVPPGELDDGFFDALRATYDALHARGIVHVDSSKRRNVLVGDDRQPYVIDFHVGLRFARNGWWKRHLFPRLAAADIYHVYKHKAEMRPDLMRDDEWDLARRPGFVRWYESWIGPAQRGLARLLYPGHSRRRRRRRPADRA